jgi:hypothetical protein
MRQINEAHVAAPGLAVVEVAAADETAFAVQELLAARYAIAPADRTTREPSEPGVRLRFFLDLHQEPGSYAADGGPTPCRAMVGVGRSLVGLAISGCHHPRWGDERARPTSSVYSTREHLQPADRGKIVNGGRRVAVRVCRRSSRSGS